MPQTLTPSTATKTAASVVRVATERAASVVHVATEHTASETAASVVHTVEAHMDTKAAASVVCNAELPSLDMPPTQYKTLVDVSPQTKNCSTKRWCCTPVSRRTTTRCSTPETCSTATPRSWTHKMLHYDVALRTG